ncbi:MAG TPA: periplasmic heavy metal sensor, partial [Bacteroidota bacterium]|nr:periplasmic heavy metal sensor [Bacteroidota bacterium]
MNVKLLIGILIFLVIVNLATTGTYLFLTLRHHAEPAPVLGGGPPPPIPMDLSSDQQEKLHQLMRSFHDDTRAMHDSIKTVEDSTMSMLQHNPVDRQAIEALMATAASLHLRISERAVQSLMDAKAFLTPEQQKHFYNMIMR